MFGEFAKILILMASPQVSAHQDLSEHKYTASKISPSVANEELPVKISYHPEAFDPLGAVRGLIQRILPNNTSLFRLKLINATEDGM